MDHHSARQHRSHDTQHRSDRRHHRQRRTGHGTASKHQGHRGLDEDQGHLWSGPAHRTSSLVENWLTDVSRRGVVSPEAPGERWQNQEPQHPQVPEWRPHGISIQDSFRQSHKRSRSRDSSIIAYPRGNPAGLSQKPTRHHKVDVEQPRFFDEPRSEHAIQPGSRDSPKFEKRARRRTREDRYDSEKQPRQKPRKETADRSSRPPKKSLSSAKEVMENFQSGSILQEKLTVIIYVPNGRWMMWLTVVGRSSLHSQLAFFTTVAFLPRNLVRYHETQELLFGCMADNH